MPLKNKGAPKLRAKGYSKVDGSDFGNYGIWTIHSLNTGRNHPYVYFTFVGRWVSTIFIGHEGR